MVEERTAAGSQEPEKKSHKKKKHTNHGQKTTWDPQELPPAVRRRRRTSLYRHSAKSAMFDKVIIGFAVLIAFVMITTKGCDRSVKGLTKLLGATEHKAEPTKMDLNNDKQ